MYKIIGADQKEYGPVSAEQLRQWIAEGRVNGQTPLQAEGTTGWKPLGMFPEFASVLATSGAAPIPPPLVVDHGVLPSNIRERDYDLDIGNCIGRAWELLKNNFWPVVGISLLVLIVIGAINQLLGLLSRPAINSMAQTQQVTALGVFLILVSSALQMPVQAVMMGGLYRYYLKLIRNEPAGLADAFTGFNIFVPLPLVGLVKGILTMLGVVACILPGLYLGVAWVFATALVADKNLGFWDAMELSRQVVTKHWFVIFALLILVALIGIAGLFACCIGVLVSTPLGQLALMYAYEDIFGHRQT